MHIKILSYSINKCAYVAGYKYICSYISRYKSTYINKYIHIDKYTFINK